MAIAVSCQGAARDSVKGSAEKITLLLNNRNYRHLTIELQYLNLKVITKEVRSHRDQTEHEIWLY